MGDGVVVAHCHWHPGPPPLVAVVGVAPAALPGPPPPAVPAAQAPPPEPVDFPGLDVCPYGTAAAWIAADAPHSAYKAAAAVAPLSKRLYFAHKSTKLMVCRGCYTLTPANAFHRSCSTQLGGEPLTGHLFAVTSGVVAAGLVAGWKAQSEAEAQAADAVREAALAAGLAEIAELKAQLEAAKGAQPAPKAPDQAAAALAVAALANSKAAEAEGAGAPGGGMAGWGGGVQAGATGTGTGSDTGVLDAVTRGGSEARSVVAQLVTLRGELEPMTELCSRPHRRRRGAARWGRLWRA